MRGRALGAPLCPAPPFLASLRPSLLRPARSRPVRLAVPHRASSRPWDVQVLGSTSGSKVRMIFGQNCQTGSKTRISHVRSRERRGMAGQSVAAGRAGAQRCAQGMTFDLDPQITQDIRPGGPFGSKNKGNLKQTVSGNMVTG